MRLLHEIMFFGSFVILFIAIATLLIYLIRYGGKKDFKDLKAGTILSDEDGLILFFIRLAITIVAATIYGYIASLILRFYYPTRLSQKLKRLRYTPRINPKTGNKMQLLSEDEEDVYLDEGQRAEEDAFSIDYDVWIDQATGDTTVEKYEGHLTALK